MCSDFSSCLICCDKVGCEIWLRIGSTRKTDVSVNGQEVNAQSLEMFNPIGKPYETDSKKILDQNGETLYP